MNLIESRRYLALALVAVSLGACSGGGSGNSGGIGGPGPQTASLTVSLMDGPVDDVKEVNVQIAAMWIKPSGDGPAFELPLENAPVTVNLLGLTDENAAVLVDNAAIEPGSYEWLSMDINGSIDTVFDSFVVTDTEEMREIEIFVPSGRLRLVSGFDVEPNQALKLLFDWDLRTGLVNPPGLGGYILKPAFRVIDVSEYGVVRGAILVSDVTLEANECDADSSDYDVGNVVYVFAGNDIVADDIDGIDPEPLATIDATLSDDSTQYEYRTLLPYGDYTVAFTCQAANDIAETNELGNPDPADDSMAFFDPAANMITIGPAPAEVDIRIDFPYGTPMP
jgi:hypothetical protein